MTATAPTSTSTATTATTDTATAAPTATSAPSTMPPLSLTLILAATPSLGIGKNGGLPWPQLRKEMAYFKRVTMRVPPTTSTSTTPTSASSATASTTSTTASTPTTAAASSTASATAPTQPTPRINALIMGRKTWDSIPPRFRPLSSRLNIVITRDPSSFLAKTTTTAPEGPLVVGSLKEAVERLRAYRHPNVDNVVDGNAETKGTEIARVFVIGGATIYAEAMRLEETDRVLLTRVESEFECDTFFGVDLEGSGEWRRCGGGELEEWTGEERGVAEVVEEKGVRFGFGMWERVRG